MVRALSPLCVRNCASALAETGPLCEVGAGGKVALRSVLGKVSSSTSVRVPKSQLPHVQLRAGTASPLYKTRLGSGLDAGVGALAAPVLVLPALWLDRAFQERFLDFRVSFKRLNILFKNKVCSWWTMCALQRSRTRKEERERGLEPHRPSSSCR